MRKNKANEEEKVRKLCKMVDGELYEQYSGRFMCGDVCMGVVCDNINRCLLAAGKIGLKNPKTDNMGLQYIVYFPSIKSL